MVGSLGSSCRHKRFLSCPGCSSRPSTKYFFLTIHYFILFVPIAQQAGHWPVVQGRVSLKSSYLSLRATCSLNAAKHILFYLFCHIFSLTSFYRETFFTRNKLFLWIFLTLFSVSTANTYVVS